MYEKIFYDKCSNINTVFNSLMNSSDGFSRLSSSFTVFTIEERITAYQANSIGIKLGDAIEAWVNQFVKDHGYQLLVRQTTLDTGKNGDFDFVYTLNNTLWFAEIKIRDDHDSTKKVGQCDDYLNKVRYLQKHYPNFEIHSCIWFVDPILTKNKNYYLSRLNQNEVLYGDDFDTFIEIPGLFNTLLQSLNNYRQNRLNYQPTQNISINIADYSTGKWLKFLTSNQQIIDYFYPQGVPYADLLNYTKTKAKRSEVIQLINLCEERLNGI